MKICFHLFLLPFCAVLLSSCATATAVITPTATITQAVALVAPSPTPVPTPFPPTAIPTENPLAGAPDGATGKDANGNWTKAENGVTYTWKVLQLNNNNENTISGWFTSHVQNGTLHGGIPFYEEKNNYGGLVTIPFFFNVKQGVNAPYLQHPQRDLSNSTPDYESVFYRTLLQAALNITGSVKSDQYNTFYGMLNNNDVAVPFATRTGSFVWKPGSERGYIFNVVSWEDADPAVHPEFYEIQDWQAGKSVLYRFALYTDTEGNLICVGAVKDANSLTIDQFLSWTLNPMEKVLTDHNAPVEWTLPNIRTGWGFSGYPTPFVHFAEGAGGTSPEFIIIPSS